MRILVAVDLDTPRHTWLVGRACDFATKIGARVDIVYARRDAARLNQIDNYDAQLRELIQGLPPERRGVARCEVGLPDEVLVALSGDYHALVVGPREPLALERMLRGTMAMRVLLRAHAPVLIPRAANWADRRPRVLVGVDINGPNQQAVLDQAGAWAKALDATVDAVYAVAERIPYIKESTVRDRAEQEWRVAHQAELDSVSTLLQRVDAGNRGEAVLRRGQPEAVLVNLSGDYDLVVVGNREREGITGFILGAVAQHVVRNSACDVLTLPTADLP